jgi:hypothetical protein
VRGSGRIESSRKHGPFDPRFLRRPSAPTGTTRVGVGLDGGKERRVKGRQRELEAIQGWESEGGALRS